MEGVLSVEKGEERALSASKWRIIALLATLFVAVGTVWRTSVTRQNAVGSVEVEVWMQNPLNAVISDKALNDNMVVDCVPNELKLVPGQLQLLAGFTTYGDPAGGTILADRGQFSSLKGGSYDYVATYQDVIDGYDSMLSACTDIANGVKESDPLCPSIDCVFPDGTVTNDCVFGYGNNSRDAVNVQALDDDPETFLFNVTKAIPCIESCVQDRIITYSSTVGVPSTFGNCTDPVSAAMVYGVPLMKSCFSATYDCTEGGIHDCPFTQCFDCVNTCFEL